MSASLSASELVETLFQKALALHRDGRLEEAERCYQRILDLNPREVRTLHLLGVIALRSSRLAKAEELFSRVITLAPQFAAVHNDLGNVRSGLGRPRQAIESYDRAIVLAPGWADAHYNRANALFELEQHRAAVEGYRRAIALAPAHAAAYANLGNALRALGDYAAAAESYERALAIKPNNPGIHNNRGVVLCDAQRPRAAIACFEAALALQPDYVEAHLNLASAQRRLHRFDAAAERYAAAIRYRPEDAQAHADLGDCLYYLRRYEEAVTSFDRSVALDPRIESVPGVRLHCLQQTGDWRDRERQLAALAARIERSEAATSPLLFFGLSGSMALQKQLAAQWAVTNSAIDAPLPVIERRGRREKIRIGYFSPDYYNHPVSILMADIFELHDRARFEVCAFSYGPVVHDPLRERLDRAFDRLHDVHGRSERDIATLARDMQLDIAVDLAGYTGAAKIFAYRAAPIQVSYLGYVGTLGAAFMDYLIADETIIPVDLRDGYTEKILYLPLYQANPRTRIAAPGAPSRAQLGLPADGFVFSCFNSNYKITPDVFGSWMRILQRVDGSSLLLYAENATAERNFRREARERGVDETRLVFSGRLAYPDHLARFRAADLFLDTLPFNGGTTVSDALWAGLPVLTCCGEAFSSRMAASLLRAMDLPELITSTLVHYEETAVALALDTHRCLQMKRRVAEGLNTSPLFDSARFTHNLEAGFAALYERHQSGAAPDHVVIRE